jgi:F0F1-type ATP synthase membrane subunit c/vacuolar-type H+-ATPase subunit K
MRIERIIWSGIVVSTFIYALIVYVTVAPRTHGLMDDSLKTPLVIILYGLALAAFIAGLVTSHVMRDRPPRIRMIVTLAIYESCAIYGLVAAFITGDWRLYVAPWVLALIGFARMFPIYEPV